MAGILAVVVYKSTHRPMVVEVQPPQGIQAPLNPPHAVKQPPKAPEGQLVTVQVTSNPPGAEVQRDDELQDKPILTPATLQVKKGTSLNLKLHLDGYSDETRSVQADKDQQLAVAFAAVKAPAKVPDKVSPPAKDPSGDEPGAEEPVKPEKVSKRKGRTPGAGKEGKEGKEVKDIKGVKAGKGGKGGKHPKDDPNGILPPMF